VKINPVFFLKKSIELYPKCILSLGWTSFNDASMSANYTWENVYSVFQLLKNSNILHTNTEITFAIRMQWSVRSLFRLIWLHKFTNCSFTIWSHDTDEINSHDQMLLFRNYLPNHLVYYDLAQNHDSILKSKIYDQDLLKSYLNENNNKFNPNLWIINSNEFIYECDYSALMISNGAKYTSRKEYKAKDKIKVYEVYGSFEIISNDSKLNAYANISQNDERENNIAIDNSSNEKIDSISCLKISLRSSFNSLNESDMNSNPNGSINFYVYINGLVQIYVGNKMEQEANLQPSKRFEYSITDVGESNSVHFDLNSYDFTTGSKYSLQLLVNSKYYTDQEFYVSQTLLGSHVIGIDALKISDEISDPQDLDSIENQIRE